MTMTTASIVLALSTVAGCTSDGGSDDDASSPTPTSPSSTPPITTQAPSVDPNTPGAVALRGDWEIASEDYVLHLIEDGTFIEDYMGIKDFRTGKYEVEGDTISLVGDEGDTDEGKIVGDTLEFILGTATRVE